MAKEEEFRGYCMKCRKKRKVMGKYRETANGRGMLQGECPRCETKVSVMTQKREEEAPKKKKKVVA